MAKEKEEQETTKTKLSQLTEEEREKIVEKWKKRFKQAEDFKKPYQDKWLRMWYLYRAYRDKKNYAYGTNLMPPTGFEIVETVKPRLTSAKINIRILPRFKKDVNSPSLENWDDKIKYDLEEANFEEKKSDFITSGLIFGDGVVSLSWGKKKNEREGIKINFEDLWLLYPDPEMTNPQEDGGYMIQLSYKKKKQLAKEDEQRGESKLYEGLDEVEDKEISDDPRKERNEVNTKKMSQIDTGKDSGEFAEDKMKGESKVELWQIWDYDEDMLITIANQEKLIRYEENPYKNINSGRLFFIFSDHQVLWELWSVGHLEPVETTIHEIADSRNQAMDDITYNLDPIRKKRKGARIKDESIKVKPGAIWELENVDDVIVERPAEISRQWIEKDTLLKREIQTSLAISEYAMGLPKSGQEPKSKVELLLMQTNIRFSILVSQMSLMLTDIVNVIIQMNREFLEEEEEMRLFGEDGEPTFKNFSLGDKEVNVDAIVDIEPVITKSPDKRLNEALEAKSIFVDNDPPNPEKPGDTERYEKAKRTIGKKILEEFDMSQYEDLILGAEEMPIINQGMQMEGGVIPQPEKIPMLEKIPEGELGDVEEQAIIPQGEQGGGMPAVGGLGERFKNILSKIPLLNKLT